ncbi:MAG: hypothetical protein U0930_23175 [Pirellulales bacterium]
MFRGQLGNVKNAETQDRIAIWFLILSAIPILFSLRWVAINFPCSSELYLVDARWIDDRYVVVQHQYLTQPKHRNLHYARESLHVHRDYLVDCEDNTRSSLTIRSPKLDRWTFPEVAEDGSIIRIHYRELEKVNPKTLETTTFTLDQVPPQSHGMFSWPWPIFVGGRYLVALNPYTHDLLWRDILSDSAELRKCEFDTYEGSLNPVAGSDAFYLELDPESRGVTLSEERASGLAKLIEGVSEANTVETLGGSELRRARRIAALYSLSDDGPTLVAKWPMAGNAQGSVGYIVSLSVDATKIEVRNAKTGTENCQIPFPRERGIHDELPFWNLFGSTLTISTEDEFLTYELATGNRILTEDGRLGKVYGQSEAQYITVDHSVQDNRKFVPLEPPSLIQLRSKADGQVESSFTLNDAWHSLSFSLAGSLLKFVDHLGNPTFLDAATGTRLKYVDPLLRDRWLFVVVGLVASVWIFIFWRLCDRINVSIWVRSSVLTLVIVGYATYRIDVTGNSQCFDRLAWQVVFGFGWALGIAFVTSARHVSCRIVYRFALVGLSTVLGLYLFQAQFGPVWGKLAVIPLITALVLLECLSVFLGIRHFFRREKEARSSLTWWPRFSSLDLLLWTTICALALWAALGIDWRELINVMDVNRWRLTDSCLSFVVAVTTWWSTRRIGWRWISVPIVIFFAIYLRATDLAEIAGLDSFADELKYAAYRYLPIASAAIAVFLDLSGRRH